ncbi:hypothetical protein I551_0993 [Mycobacterium ulcerans str. Harvey]|uniref:Uncharacterized protein n=1 Tax=Mycobacterium ulcerans str. Harvey TaxID=1299332 RepID=A0ABN0R5V2_MYCUL|nr:hypothetical protein I551_0993 [Mycobacterium ulcerans str. Harvey]
MIAVQPTKILPYHRAALGEVPQPLRRPRATAVSRPAPCKSSPLHEESLPYAKQIIPDHS